MNGIARRTNTITPIAMVAPSVPIFLLLVRSMWNTQERTQGVEPVEEALRQ
jgi:hypothetical protein